MAKSQRTLRGRAGKTRAVPAQNKTGAPRTARQVRSAGAHVSPVGFAGPSGWASDLEFDIREPKLAVSLRLDADVLRFFRGFGAGYQTRINEVLKAFMHAREKAGLAPSGGASRKKRASRS
ncbi:MAG TPA: BrnA antitoxin family protein [Acetobacteraceae bacterium]|nr:BrnA antitoxin family protein [Acetobacteraceae bacterium]